MDSQLELLLEIQDLKAQREALSEESLREVESSVFEMRVEDAVGALDEKIEELKGRLGPQVRARYGRLNRRGMRVVVPVLKGICYGCFVAVPTAVASEAERNVQLDVCQNCGRFLYHVG